MAAFCCPKENEFVTQARANRWLPMARLLGIIGGIFLAGIASAISIDIPAPPGIQNFGGLLAILPNGNFLIGANTDTGNGAILLYSPSGTLISKLTGPSLGFDVVVLKNGNFVVKSPDWPNGNTLHAGATTWGSAEIGVSGVVSSANSLVGTTAWDHVGEYVTVLENGNYVVRSRRWHNGSVAFAGAATWGNGTTGISGEVSASNSLVGTKERDFVGEEVTALSNGNYVVGSPGWDSGTAAGKGAVTWGNGSMGIAGPVSTQNSLIGFFSVWSGYGLAYALTNGNYVVTSPGWQNASGDSVGAAMWCSGAAPTIGMISANRALVGSTLGDGIGDWPVTALNNGNYVVLSAYWDNGAIADAGAATWGNGATGTVGVVSPSNSLVGSTTEDMLARDHSLGAKVIALSNGNFVLKAPAWDSGNIANAGAVTWGNGSTGTAGVISAANSLVGTTADDNVGFYLAALSNGHYVAGTPYWDNAGTPDVGAVTWANGTAATAGAVSTGNSLTGTSANDRVSGAMPLSNGNYVVASPWWNNGSIAEAGAATWVDGNASTHGAVSLANSLVGTKAYDRVGYSISPLSNGNYVVASPWWDSEAAANAGAVTWGNGRVGTVDIVRSGNSLVGTQAEENLGFQFDGQNPTYPLVYPVANGNYVVYNLHWQGNYINSTTLARGLAPLDTTINAENSVLGQVPGSYVMGDYDPAHDQLVVGRPEANVVTIFKLDELFLDSFD